jgi:hypothetical protein
VDKLKCFPIFAKELQHALTLTDNDTFLDIYAMSCRELTRLLASQSGYYSREQCSLNLLRLPKSRDIYSYTLAGEYRIKNTGDTGYGRCKKY